MKRALAVVALAAALAGAFWGGTRWQRDRDARAIMPLIARLLVCEQLLSEETP